VHTKMGVDDKAYKCNINPFRVQGRNQKYSEYSSAPICTLASDSTAAYWSIGVLEYWGRKS
jgi:hypothetical protein